MKHKLNSSEIGYICRSLSVLLHGGIGIAESVYLLAEDEKGAVGAMLSGMGELLDQGETLSVVMEKTGVFPDHVPAMVRIGEETGRLDQSLSSLANYYEEAWRNAKQIKNALAYPCMILALLLVVIAVLLIKVLPVFDNVYASLGSRLTGVAAVLLHAGEILKNTLPALLVIAAVVVLGVLLYFKNERVHALLSGWYRKRFGDKGVSRKFNNARFARALAMGMSSGLPLDEAIELSRRLLNDVPGAQARCEKCIRILTEGEGLTKAMSEAELLSPAQTRILAAGVHGGNADEVLDEIANRMQEDATDALRSVVSRVEPAIVMVVSLLVGLILLSVMLPLLSIMSVIG